LQTVAEVVDDEIERGAAKRSRVLRTSRRVSTNLEVRVLKASIVPTAVPDDIAAFKQKHFYGERLNRVDERTLSRRRGPMPQFGVAKKN